MKFFGATLVFFAELGMLAGLAWWGVHAADGVAGWVLAALAVGLVATLWGLFLAPRAPRPLKPPLVAIMVRLDLLLLGAAAAYFTGAKALGVATAALAIVGTALSGTTALAGTTASVAGASDAKPASVPPGIIE